MKIINLSLEDLEELKNGWGILKTYVEEGPPSLVDNGAIVRMKPEDLTILRSDLKIINVALKG